MTRRLSEIGGPFVAAVQRDGLNGHRALPKALFIATKLLIRI